MICLMIPLGFVSLWMIGSWVSTNSRREVRILRMLDEWAESIGYKMTDASFRPDFVGLRNSFHRTFDVWVTDQQGFQFYGRVIVQLQVFGERIIDVEWIEPNHDSPSARTMVRDFDEYFDRDR